MTENSTVTDNMTSSKTASENISIGLSKKQILAEPVSAFTRLNPDALEEQKQDMQALVEQNLELNQQKKDLQLQTRKLSRKIGEAKRNNQDISELKTSMQLLSQELKGYSQQTAEIEGKILDFFLNTENGSEITVTSTGEPSTAGADTSALVFNYGKRDYRDAVNIDEIAVTEMSIIGTGNDFNDWNHYVDQHTAGCIHHRSEWLQLMQQTYQHQCFYFAAFDKEKKIVGVLPLIRLKSRLFGDLLVSMPYFQRGGVIADHPLIELKLMQFASEQAKKLGIESIEYRDDIERDDMPVQSHKVNMVLALPQSKDELWQGFSSKLRAQIKRPQRENPDTIFGREELLDDFYAVYSRNMRDLGSPVHSKRFIANILQQLPDNSRLVVVKLKGKPVGTALLLAYGDTMEIPLASTIRSVNHLSINMWLYWQVLQFAIKGGYKFFDFGRSTKGAGTYRFKAQWGAQPQPLYWHYWLNGGELPGLNPDNPKFKLVIALWKLLPVKISQWIGPHLVKNIP